MTWMTFDDVVAPFITLAALLTVICAEVRDRATRHQRRARELKLCADLLDQHAAALGEFLDSSDAPVELKLALIRFSEITADRDLAHQVVSAACSNDRRSRGDAEAAKEIRKAVDRLGANQPEIAYAFDRAVKSATQAMIYRWPETADMFREFVTKTTVDPQKVDDLFCRAVRVNSDRPDDHISMPLVAAVP